MSDVFFQPAAIHYDQQSGIQCALRRGSIDYALLQPDRFRAGGDCFIDGFPCGTVTKPFTISAP